MDNQIKAMFKEINKQENKTGFKCTVFVNNQSTPKNDTLEASGTILSPLSSCQLLTEDLLKQLDKQSPFIQNKNDTLLTIAWEELISSPNTMIENTGHMMMKKKKIFKERRGDWICFQCRNLNFSFRVSCNRCNISKTESEKRNQEYLRYVINNVKNE